MEAVGVGGMVQGIGDKGRSQALRGRNLRRGRLEKGLGRDLETERGDSALIRIPTLGGRKI